MLISFALAAALCGPTTIETYTDEPWSERDQLGLDTAKRRCVIHFARSPCLGRFVRVEQGQYRAICTRGKP